MRFPSLFRLPKHQQFHIKPRYYDPVKEEIKERVEKLKQQAGSQQGDYHPSSIEFRRKTKSASFTSLLQLGVAAVLGLMTLGWIYIGNDVFYYLLWMLIIAYLIYRLKKGKKSK